MSKVRVYEAAKQLNVDPKAAVSLFQAAGIADVKNHMSSVEPEAIERVRRHLEKAKTHDVVEERIRPTVVKRRAVAKPGGVEHVSSPHLPAPPPSMPAIVDSGDTNGHTVLRDRESGRLPEIPAERKSTREVAVVPPPPPSSRKSTKSVGDVAAKSERGGFGGFPGCRKISRRRPPSPFPRLRPACMRSSSPPRSPWWRLFRTPRPRPSPWPRPPSRCTRRPRRRRRANRCSRKSRRPAWPRRPASNTGPVVRVSPCPRPPAPSAPPLVVVPPARCRAA